VRGRLLQEVMMKPKKKRKKKVLSKEELLEKAYRPMKASQIYHEYYQGAWEMIPAGAVRSFDDFAIWYTPGVAQSCLDIRDDYDKVFTTTRKWNTIAVVTDGTRVLGLGDIGPEAGLPVMEGKALLFKYLGGVDAVPVCLGTKDTEKIIETVKIIQPAFGGINLEDIAKPKCFEILDRLRRECDIPVWHDDQQGTAAVTVAGLINALHIVRKKPEKVKLTLVGSGASNIAIARLLLQSGIDARNMVMVDSKGTLGPWRTELQTQEPVKWHYCGITNGDGVRGGIKEALDGADVLIALSKPGPGTIRKEWIQGMQDDAIVFVCANPIPEIWPWEAAEAGARIVATGRSDFPNQVNNSLGFPGIFRGTLDVFARTITDEMCLAASESLAECAREKGVHENYIIPTMDEWEVFPREAVAVAMKAMEQGVARRELSKRKLKAHAEEIIGRARSLTRNLMKTGFIKKPPPVRM
jgi:malate dehydrogenase (oxaloacetate-decarboxylating)